ncbi:MAG: XRE family transcriptional regulator [Bacillota bacterium]
MIIGERLKLARRAAGLSLRELAANVGVTAQALSKYERGLDTPSSGVLLRLAEALGVKVEYFFRTRSVKLFLPTYRNNSNLRRKKEGAVLARVQGWLERYLEVEELFSFGEDARRFILPEGVNPCIAVPGEAERVAGELRAAWQAGLDPIENLTELLEDKGIKVGLVEGAKGFDACTFSTEEGCPVIAVRRDLPGDRQRFNLAHELGHVILRPEKGVSAEKAAHRFAGAFLVPAPAARRELGDRRHALSLYELHLLKHKYGLSMQAWVYRAKDLGIISEALARNLFREFRRRGWCEKEPGDQLPPEEPKRMERLVMRALTEDLISESRAAELVDKPLAEFWREVAERHGGFPADLRN